MLKAILKSLPDIDYENAVKRMSDNAVVYAELLRLFFKDDPLARLIDAVDQKDFDGAAFQAHSLKGTAANLGLCGVSRLAALISISLKKGDAVQASAALDELKRAYRAVKEAVYQTDGGVKDG